jgi:hypothetical protein
VTVLYIYISSPHSWHKPHPIIIMELIMLKNKNYEAFGYVFLFFYNWTDMHTDGNNDMVITGPIKGPGRHGLGPL